MLKRCFETKTLLSLARLGVDDKVGSMGTRNNPSGQIAEMYKGPAMPQISSALVHRLLGVSRIASPAPAAGHAAPAVAVPHTGSVIRSARKASTLQ